MIVAVTAAPVPFVLLFTLFASATLVVPLSVTASLPRPLMPVEAYVAFTSAAVPVKVVTAAAFTATVVLASRAIKSLAAAVASLTVIV